MKNKLSLTLYGSDHNVLDMSSEQIKKDHYCFSTLYIFLEKNIITEARFVKEDFIDSFFVEYISYDSSSEVYNVQVSYLGNDTKYLSNIMNNYNGEVKEYEDTEYKRKKIKEFNKNVFSKLEECLESGFVMLLPNIDEKEKQEFLEKFQKTFQKSGICDCRLNKVLEKIQANGN